MNRRTSLFAGAVLALTPFLVGQEAQNQANPLLPAEVIAPRDLMAWSWMQQPRPVPQPLPPPDKPVPQADPQQQPPSPQTPRQESPTQTQTFTGKIVKDGDHYVLKVSTGTAYQLDAQSNAKQFEDKDVKVVGVLDTATNIIRIAKIELLSQTQ
jgi:hypothetical protein